MLSEQAIYAALGQKVRQAREIANMRQDQLADRVGMTRTSITNIEKGNQRIQVHTLYSIANALGVSPHDLLPLPDPNDETEEEIKAKLREQTPDVQDWVKEVLSPLDREG